MLPSPRRRTLFLISLVAVLGGCAGHSGKPADDSEPQPHAEIALVVENHHWLDMVVYLVNGGLVERIGTVSGSSTGTFMLPWGKAGNGRSLRLRADPIGSPTVFTSELILVQPGSEIVLTIESVLSHSTVIVQ